MLMKIVQFSLQSRLFCKAPCPSRQWTSPPTLVTSANLVMVHPSPASRSLINILWGKARFICLFFWQFFTQIVLITLPSALFMYEPCEPKLKQIVFFFLLVWDEFLDQAVGRVRVRFRKYKIYFTIAFKLLQPLPKGLCDPVYSYFSPSLFSSFPSPILYLHEAIVAAPKHVWFQIWWIPSLQDL